ncbi:MAG: histidinol-phosphate transaminase [Lachnospiraceae bacterium]|nr:histidinol-phosphate transaminase [Lachnospiraceae bacterium]
MSRFFTERLSALTPYVPGEQPRDRRYIKLNTNESPFPPSKKALEEAEKVLGTLNLYSDPDCKALRNELAGTYGVSPDEVLVSNGSDEVLNFAFQAFGDETHPVSFPDVTYGFYPVFAALNRIPYREIPLREDFSIDPEDYYQAPGPVILANPNAQTGVALSRAEIEEIVKQNPDNVVVVDEAYVDFGGESAVPLTKQYENLLVIMTFSKSRSLAGSRLGFAIGAPALIQDLNTVRCSTNPYNVNSVTLSLGIGALRDPEYMQKNAAYIAALRETTKEALGALGFTVTNSKANFILARSDRIGGRELYLKLKERGILIRHFDTERLSDYNRITIGSREQMQVLLETIGILLRERSGAQ